MHPDATTTGLKTQIDNTLRAFAQAQPEPLLQALSLIRWLAAAQDGSNETAQQSLNDIEDIAAEAVEKPSASFPS